MMTILALLASFTHLSLRAGPSQQEIEESGRQLSKYLRSLASEASATGELLTLNIDLERGKFFHESPERSSKLLRQIKLPDGVMLSQVIGAEGTDYDSLESLVEIDIPPKGLKESLQLRLNHPELNDVILTWKLKGKICSVETEREGVDTEHWKEEVPRF